jgi:hypothetical protein
MKRGEGDMDFTLFCKLLDEVRAEGLCTVKMGGLGEPSIYERFGDAMLALRDRGIKHITYTNGTLFSRFSHAEILSWRIPHLVVSIDGVDASSFNRQRLGGNYAEVERSLVEFRAARDRASTGYPFIEVRHVILPKESPKELTHFRRQWLKVADTVMFNYIIPARISATRPRRRCRDIRREMYVRWTGRIPLCGYQYLQTDYEWIGDLRTGTIRDAWRHQRLNEVRRLHRAGGASVPDFCRNCSQTA